MSKKFTEIYSIYFGGDNYFSPTQKQEINKIYEKYLKFDVEKKNNTNAYIYKIYLDNIIEKELKFILDNSNEDPQKIITPTIYINGLVNWIYNVLVLFDNCINNPKDPINLDSYKITDIKNLKFLIYPTLLPNSGKRELKIDPNTIGYHSSLFTFVSDDFKEWQQDLQTKNFERLNLLNCVPNYLFSPTSVCRVFENKKFTNNFVITKYKGHKNANCILYSSNQLMKVMLFYYTAENQIINVRLKNNKKVEHDKLQIYWENFDKHLNGEKYDTIFEEPKRYEDWDDFFSKIRSMIKSTGNDKLLQSIHKTTNTPSFIPINFNVVDKHQTKNITNNNINNSSQKSEQNQTNNITLHINEIRNKISVFFIKNDDIMKELDKKYKLILENMMNRQEINILNNLYSTTISQYNNVKNWLNNFFLNYIKYEEGFKTLMIDIQLLTLDIEENVILLQNILGEYDYNKKVNLLLILNKFLFTITAITYFFKELKIIEIKEYKSQFDSYKNQIENLIKLKSTSFTRFLFWNEVQDITEINDIQVSGIYARFVLYLLTGVTNRDELISPQNIIHAAENYVFFKKKKLLSRFIPCFSLAVKMVENNDQGDRIVLSLTQSLDGLLILKRDLNHKFYKSYVIEHLALQKEKTFKIKLYHDNKFISTTEFTKLETVFETFFIDDAPFYTNKNPERKSSTNIQPKRINTNLQLQNTKPTPIKVNESVSQIVNNTISPQPNPQKLTYLSKITQTSQPQIIKQEPKELDKLKLIENNVPTIKKEKDVDTTHNLQKTTYLPKIKQTLQLQKNNPPNQTPNIIQQTIKQEKNTNQPPPQFLPKLIYPPNNNQTPQPKKIKQEPISNENKSLDVIKPSIMKTKFKQSVLSLSQIISNISKIIGKINNYISNIQKNSVHYLCSTILYNLQHAILPLNTLEKIQMKKNFSIILQNDTILLSNFCKSFIKNDNLISLSHTCYYSFSLFNLQLEDSMLNNHDIFDIEMLTQNFNVIASYAIEQEKKIFITNSFFESLLSLISPMQIHHNTSLTNFLNLLTPQHLTKQKSTKKESFNKHLIDFLSTNKLPSLFIHPLILEKKMLETDFPCFTITKYNSPSVDHANCILYKKTDSNNITQIHMIIYVITMNTILNEHEIHFVTPKSKMEIGLLELYQKIPEFPVSTILTVYQEKFDFERIFFEKTKYFGNLNSYLRQNNTFLGKFYSI